MNIAIIGYGKMGRKIEEIALSRGHNITARIDPNNPADHKIISKDSLESADVCIEFSTPQSVIGNIETVMSLKKNLVVGTTGWYDDLNYIKGIVSDAGLIYASNFSIGMNLFYRITKYAAELFNLFPEYDVSGLEFHHNKKLDSPSGTARTLANLLVEVIDRKTTPVYNLNDRKINPAELHFSSVRCGSFPGTHKIIFDSPADTVELSHSVRNRDGFAFGAVIAAEWISGKNGIYTFDNLINNLVNNI